MLYKIIDLKRTESNPTEPVTLTEVKRHLHITDTENDTELTDLITRCRKFIEHKTSVSMVVKTVILTVDLEGEIELPYGPIDEVTEVKVRTGTATDGTAEYDTLTGDEYTTDGESFKVLSSSVCGRHTITYSTTGLDDENLKLALLEEILFRYEKRGDETDKGISAGVLTLIEPFIRLTWL